MRKQVTSWLSNTPSIAGGPPAGVIAALMALMVAPAAQAWLVAENATVPAAMSATGGSESDPSIYRFSESYAKDFGASPITVGNSVDANWVRLEVVGGAQVVATGGNALIGSDSKTFRTDFNSAWIMGEGSSLTLGATRLGGKSAQNTLAVVDGGTVTVNGEFRSGYENSGYDCTYNVVLVDGGILNANASFSIGYGVTHDACSLVVRNGGKILAPSTGRIRIRGGNRCEIRVEGAGSLIETDYSHAAYGAVSLGEMTTTCHHNTLTISDGGTVKLTNPEGTLTIAADATQGGSGVRFAGGILAVMDNRPTHIPYDKVWLWDGDSWEPAPSNWKGTFFTDETTAAAAGYTGFGGYTVFTGGSPLTAP